MPAKKKRSEVYREVADALTRTCMRSIDSSGRSAMDRSHGAPSVGHVVYAMGELNRCRLGIDLTAIYGLDLISVARAMIDSQLDLKNEIHRCFLSMGLGLLGPAGRDHPVLKGVPGFKRELIDEGLVADKEFDNNWEAFNGSILIGRHMLYGDSADDVLPHFEKIASKYDATGYFDDTLDLGNYNNYGLMSINYPLRAAEFLDIDHPARRVIENRFKEHALRYVDLVDRLVSPRGDTWPFGRSAGVLGQLQCVVLIEQCLSKGWIDPERVNRFRAIARSAVQRMADLYWDESMEWFNFHDEYQTAYDYRASLPMAWDMLRYFLQAQSYAEADEGSGVPEEEPDTHDAVRHEEVVTNPKLKTSIYIWSDGDDHAVLPIMAGPHQVTGDTLARPYAQGLFEWTTQHAIPALCPRLTLGGDYYWPAWHADRTELIAEGVTRIFRVRFDPLYSDRGGACPLGIVCQTSYEFSSGQFGRIDVWSIPERLEIEEYRLEVLQPARHPGRRDFGDVHELEVVWESDIESITLAGKSDVSGSPAYRSYHGHASHAWKIEGKQIPLAPGRYKTELRLRW